ncbi:hypothetical protein ACF0H5_020597 [Mactra antiquata]
MNCVRSNGCKSNWFPVLQGARQGQCLSPYFYLLYINNLMDDIENSTYCYNLNGVSCGCPTSTDDMVIQCPPKVLRQNSCF